MDEAFGQEDARLLVALHGGPVVVPADPGVVAQVAGGALEGQPVSLEHHLAEGRDEVVRVQLQGPLCGRRQGQRGLSAQASGPVPQGRAGPPLEPKEGKRGRRKSLERGAQGKRRRVVDA